MSSLILALSLSLTGQTPSNPLPAQPSQQQEVLGPEQQQYFQEYGGWCVAQQILQGPEHVGKWRVKVR